MSSAIALLDFLRGHDRFLRTELVRLVRGLFGLLHGVEDHERIVAQPGIEVAVHRLFVDVEVLRLAVADHLDASVVPAIETDQVRPSTSLAVEAEATLDWTSRGA